MMKGQKGYVLVVKTPSRDFWGERVLRCEAVRDMALKETGGKKQEENGRGRKNGA